MSSRVEFAERLNSARIKQNLSIRALARRVDLPPATVQGWLNGKHFPVAALRMQYLRIAEELGLADQVPDLWGESWAELRPILREVSAPYLGLRPYGVADAELFFGRSSESARLAAAVRELHASAGHGIMVVVGPSGSGKSSLLAAGLVAGECTDGALSGWRAAIGTADATFSADGLDLVVIDQFESVLADDAPPDRDQALAAIAELGERAIVVLGLRSDAFAAAATEPVLTQALTRPFLLTPLDRDGLREVITGPAALAGVEVEADLVRSLELDLAPGPSSSVIGTGVLPLLSTALLVTWAAGSGRRLSLADFEAAGGVSAAVESLAEEVFTSLDDDQQRAAKALFLRLIALHGDHVVRRVIDLASIASGDTEVMDAFVAARMLTVADDCVQISHDALIQHWSRLATWTDESRADLTALANLRSVAQVWVDSDRDEAALLPLPRLALFSSWITDEARQQLLAPQEREFLAACQTQYESQLEAERHTNARLRRRGRLAVVLAAATTTLAMVSATLYAQARTSQNTAQVATQQAQSRQVAIASRTLRAKDTNLVTQLATVSLALSDTQDARSAVLDATAVDAPLRWAGGGSAVLAVLPDAGLVARGGGTGTVSLWRGGRLDQAPVDFSAGNAAVAALATHRVGGTDLLAAGGTGFRGLWDVTGEPKRLAELSEGEVRALAFAPDGRRLVVGLASGRVDVYDISEAAAPRLVTSVTLDREDGSPAAVPAVMSLAVAADEILYVGGPLGSIARWQLGAKAATRLPDVSNLYVPTGGTTPAATRTQSLAISPDGTRLAAGQGGRAALLWKLVKGKASGLTVVRGFNSWVNAVGFSTDSRLLITGCSDQNVTIFDVATQTARRTMATPALVTGAALLDDRPVAVGDDGMLRAWDASGPVLREATAIPTYNLATDSRSTGWLVAGNYYGLPNLWRITDGATVRMADPQVSLPDGDTLGAAVAVARSGRYLVAASQQGRVVSWALTDSGAATASVVDTGLGSIATTKVSPDDNLVAAVEDLGKSVALLRPDADGRLTLVGTLTAPGAGSVDFSYDSRILVVTRADAGIELWSVADPANPARVGAIPAAKNEQKVAASRVSSQVAIGDITGTVTLFDTADPANPVLVRRFTGPAGGIQSVDLSPDGKFIVANAADDRVWVWSLDRPGEAAYAALDGDFGRPWDARFIDGGAHIAVSGADGRIKLWASSAPAAVAKLCAARGTPLTADEWSRFLPGVDPVDPC